MRPLYQFLRMLVVATTLAAAQPASAQDTTWFDASNKPVDRDQAAFYETRAHTDSGTAFTDHWMNNRVKVTGTIGSDMQTRIGTFAYYDTAGVLQRRCRYTSKDNAVETDYYPGGQVMAVGNLVQERRDGDWTGYYPSGKPKAKVSYKAGQQASASYVNEDGSPNTTMNVFFQDADYAGGAWLRFLNHTLRYPDAAVNDEIMGTVLIKFKISAEGKASDFTVIRSAGPTLDKEALRVMSLSDNWQPAIRAGTPQETYKVQPINFRLESVDSKGRPEKMTADNSEVFSKVEIESTYPGGTRAWNNYVARHLKYPRKGKGEQGAVVVEFIVDRNGNVGDVQAISGPDTGGFREEAVRLIRESGKWMPAILNGHQVRSLKTQSIDFAAR